MATGNRRLRINTQERAVSTDINRLQTFAQQDLAEMFRYWLDVFPTNEDDALGMVSEPSTIETPLRAEILGGLMVKPQAGSLNLFVDPGMAWVMSPDAAADESNYKHIREDGIATVGALTVGAGGGGAIRIDVVECQVNATEAIVSESRDIFNATTGAFSATSVTKELRGRMTFRVRAGVAGSGFPGTVSGWLPIAVISVPSAATSVDTMTFWDVRPLVSDRRRTPSNLADGWPVTERAHFILDHQTSAGQLRMVGQVRSTVADRRVGGFMRRGTPGTDNAWLDLRDSANFASGFTYGASAYAYLYLLTPFGLPRWARYTDGPAGRVPRAPLGIPVISAIQPKHATGQPQSAVNLPTSTGLGTSTASGVCIAPLFTDLASIPIPGHAFGQTFMLGYQDMFARNEIPPTVPTTLAAPGISTFTEGTTHPANARALYLKIQFVHSLPTVSSYQSGNNPSVGIYIPGSAATFGAGMEIARVGCPTWQIDNPSGVGKSIAVSYMVRVPITSQYPTAAAAAFKATIDFAGGGGTQQVFGTAPTLTNLTVSVVGWDLGP